MKYTISAIIVVVLVVSVMFLKPVLFEKQEVVNVINTELDVEKEATTTPTPIPVVKETIPPNVKTVVKPEVKPVVAVPVVTLPVVNVPVVPQVNSYSLLDIAKHNRSSDCWMAISGTVYNVTNYADSHPGGDAIYRGCGIDATVMYERVDGHGKSKATRDLASLKIGVLK